MLRRLSIVVACCGLAITARAEAPAFVAGPCALPNVSPAIQPRLRCGSVSVPRDYDHADGGHFKLAVVVIASERQPALSEPVVYISGGPGAPLTIHAGAQAAYPIARDRDIILVDQRGTGRSEPALCPGLSTRFAAAMVDVATAPAGSSERLALFAACRDQAVARGIDLADFGTQVTVSDFEQVRRALGITRWNVFGVSYGTTVTMTLMALHPDTIRAAVLDSINPPDPLLPPWSANVADARAAFFDFCRRDSACSAVTPDLALLYQATLDRLRNQPIPALTSDLFAFVVGRMIYYPEFYPALPRLIAQVHDGDAAGFMAVVARMLAAASDPDTGNSFAANAAVDCRDRPRFRETPGTDIFDRELLYGICAEWSPLGPAPLVPVGTAIPTLILQGQFDPNARPAASRALAAAIGQRATLIDVAQAGHSVRSTMPCAARIVSAFFDDPEQAVDHACADPEPIQFLAR